MPVDVEAARALTPGCAHVVHLNHAGASLMPQPVIDAVVGHLGLEARIGGYEAAEEVADRIDAVYASLAALIGAAAPQEIALTGSATEAWDSAFLAVPLGPGDRVLTWRSEYSSNAMAMARVVATTGAEVTVLPDDDLGQADLAALDVALEDPRVRLVALTHVPTSGGLVQPASEVGRRCREAGVLFLLDACQSVGQLDVRVDEIGCDMLSATGRKFLRGPRGTGFLHVRADATDRLVPRVVDLHSATWTAPFAYEPVPGARRFETFEASVAGQLGLGAAADHALGWGLRAIEERVVAMAESLRDRLRALPGVAVHDLGARRSGIVTFTVDGEPPGSVTARLRAAGVNVWVSPGEASQLDLLPRGLADGVVRASVHYLTTDDELDLAVAVVARG